MLERWLRGKHVPPKFDDLSLSPIDHPWKKLNVVTYTPVTPELWGDKDRATIVAYCVQVQRETLPQENNVKSDKGQALSSSVLHVYSQSYRPVHIPYTHRQHSHDRYLHTHT